MLSESSTVIRIIEGISKLLKVEYTSNRKIADAYVSEVLKHVKNIAIPDDLTQDKVDYSHELVKRLYLNASNSIGDIVSSNDLAKIYQALSSARIHYWIRKYRGKPGEEISELINDRIKRIRHGEVRHQSNEYITKKILDLDNSHPTLIEHEIELIHADCLADIAELEELHLSVVKSRAKKW